MLYRGKERLLTAWDRSDFDSAVKVINVMRPFAVVCNVMLTVPVSTEFK